MATLMYPDIVALILDSRAWTRSA